MSAEEWASYKEEEEAVVALAEERASGDTLGAAARRLENMEDAMKELVQMAKSLEPGDTKPAEDKMERLRKQVLFWRRGMRKCDAHPAYPDAHKMFNSNDCAGVFGRAP